MTHQSKIEAEELSYLSKDYDTILVDRDGPAVIVTFNRMDKYNAMNGQLKVDLADALDEIKQDRTVRGVIFWGGSKAFIAGADVKEMLEVKPLDVFNAFAKNPDVWDMIAKFPIPTVAAIAGACVGGGLELAMACDLRVTASNAMIGQSELNVGLIPGRGGTQRLARLVGMTRAKEMILCGEMITGEHALELGLVNASVPTDEVLTKAKDYVARIAQKSPQSATLAKVIMNAGQDLTLDSALMMESLAFVGMFTTDDMREGIDAFMKKRRPEFKGK